MNITAKELTAKELQEQDPSRFEREYYEWRLHNPCYDWWDWTYDDFKERALREGVTIDDIEFSVGYCQSDYASWGGSVELRLWLETSDAHKDDPRTFVLCELLRDGAADARVHVSQIGARCRGPRVDLDMWHEPDEDELIASGPLMGASVGELWDSIGGYDYIEEIEQDLQDWAESLADEMYRALRDELEYLTSEESFIEDCEANGVTFEVDDDDDCHNCDK